MRPDLEGAISFLKIVGANGIHLSKSECTALAELLQKLKEGK